MCIRSIVIERVIRILIFLLYFLVISGCMYKGEQMETETGDANARVQFDLPSGIIELNVEDLEKIKKALVSYFQAPGKGFRPYLEFQKPLLEEAQKLPCWIDADVAHVGRWILQLRSDKLVLVRPPPRAEIMYLFVATLIEQNSGWQISEFVHERQVAR